MCNELRHLDGIKSLRKDRKRTPLCSCLPPSPLCPFPPPSRPPCLSHSHPSGASVRCSERRCACVREPHRSAHWFRRTSPDNGARQPDWWWRGRLDPDQEQEREKHRGYLYSPLSGNMSEFFLLAFLALSSGLFPCVEPSKVSDEEKGKPEQNHWQCAVR